jgi:hypothetical protein
MLGGERSGSWKVRRHEETPLNASPRKLALAVLGVWATLVALLVMGELAGALDTALVTDVKYKPAPVSKSFAPLTPPPPIADGLEVRWNKVMYLVLAPAVLLAVAIGLFGWARRTRASVGESPSAQSPGEASFFLSSAFFVLRLVRGAFYAVAAFQVLGLLPALSWVLTPNEVTPSHIAQLLTKLLFLAIALTLVWSLRRLIDWLHVRQFGVPHPALAARRLAL